MCMPPASGSRARTACAGSLEAVVHGVGIGRELQDSGRTEAEVGNALRGIRDCIRGYKPSVYGRCVDWVGTQRIAHQLGFVALLAGKAGDTFLTDPTRSHVAQFERPVMHELILDGHIPLVYLGRLVEFGRIEVSDKADCAVGPDGPKAIKRGAQGDGGG